MLLAFAVPVPARADGDRTAETVPAPAAKLTVQVLGRVKKPGEVVLDAGARLSDALTAAGAFVLERLIARVGGTPIVDPECTPGGPQLRYVYIMRTSATDSSKTTGYAVDLARMVQHDVRFDMLLSPNDKIFVPECRSLIQPIPMVDPEPS
jgi:protein involved in polysaccharide export with SLBB domain